MVKALTQNPYFQLIRKLMKKIYSNLGIRFLISTIKELIKIGSKEAAL